MIIKNIFLEEVELSEDLKNHTKELENIGLDCSEIGYFINLKIDKEIIIDCD